ncbi:hypothetical protein A4G18_05670 [Pasteurellaceae bacterium Pebbles2]|nr:hypothetical protein [Pasteurellaceae bacterium Pebbles2]
MFLTQHVKSVFLIILASITIVGCEVVELDSAGKPIIPMSAEEAASLANMDPKDIADRMWNDIYQDANKSSIELNQLETIKKNNISYFVKFRGTIESIDEKSKSKNIKVNLGKNIISIQVGDITKGNAIRDASALISFDQFKNQIQFSKLSKELNKNAIKALIKIDNTAIGKKIEVLSALTIKNDQIQDAVPLNIKFIN